MSGWRTMVAAPLVCVLAYFVAWNYAALRFDPSLGTSNFERMVFDAAGVGMIWLVVAIALIATRVLVLPSTDGWSRLTAALASVTNAFAVAYLFGDSALTIGEPEGWPDSPLAIGALIVAGGVSLAPAVILWTPGLRTPRGGEVPHAAAA